MLLPASLLAVTVPDFTVAASFSSGYSKSLPGLGSSSSSPIWLLVVSASAALSLFITLRVLWSFGAWVKTRGYVQSKSPNQCEAASISLTASAEKVALKSLQTKTFDTTSFTTPTPSPASLSVPARKSPSPPPRTGTQVPTSHGSNSFQQKPSRWRWVAAFMPSRARWLQITSSMPVSFSSLSVSKDAKLGRGVGVVEGGMRQISPPPRPTMRREGSEGAARRNGKAPGPTFETPVPALYQAEVPASMARIILSRHTFRKSAPGAPRKPITPSSLQRPAV